MPAAAPTTPSVKVHEPYFWSFIVALLVFAFGADVSIYKGVLHVRHPEPIVDPLVNYVVLVLAYVSEAAAQWVSFFQLREAKGFVGYYEAFRSSKDPPSFMESVVDHRETERNGSPGGGDAVHQAQTDAT